MVLGFLLDALGELVLEVVCHVGNALSQAVNRRIREVH